MRSSLLDHRKITACELRKRDRRNLDHHVDTTRQHFGNACVAVGNRAEDNGLAAGLAIPIAVVARNDNRFVGTPGVKFERT